ncbi:hypothetical protein MNEG_16293, partial [Monoraphidium neglectum]
LHLQARLPAHELHQVHDRPPAGRRRRRRGHRHAEGHRDGLAAPHHQFGGARCGRPPRARVRGREAAAGRGCGALEFVRVWRAQLVRAVFEVQGV